MFTLKSVIQDGAGVGCWGGGVILSDQHVAAAVVVCLPQAVHHHHRLLLMLMMLKGEKVVGGWRVLLALHPAGEEGGRG